MPAIPAVRAMHVQLRGITEQHGRGVAVPKLLSASRAFNSIRVRLNRPLVYFSEFRVVLFQRLHNDKDNLCYSEMTQFVPHPPADSVELFAKPPPPKSENAENPQAIARGFLYSHKGRYEPFASLAMRGMHEHTNDTRCNAIAATQMSGQPSETMRT